MIDSAGKRAVHRKFTKGVREGEIDRLLSAARAPKPESRDDPTTDHDLPGRGHEAVLPHTVDGSVVTIWDVPVFILYACLGVFTRIWTDITLYFDFGMDSGFRMFAFGVLLAMHAFIMTIVYSAWRAKWEIRTRNLMAIAALAGYLGCRLLTHM